MGSLYPIAALGKTVASGHSPHIVRNVARFKLLMALAFLAKPFS
jgi:hypothetical protein